VKPYAFDLERSAQTLRLNRFLHGLTIPEKRKRFLESPEDAMKSLSTEEKDMVRRLDWKGMQDYGASFFCLEKLARTKGVSNPEMVAAFRGETLEAFLKTRRVPGARPEACSTRRKRCSPFRRWTACCEAPRRKS
jgi:gallate dioxygenase